VLISTTGDCVDENCDGQIDEGVTTRYYRDADGDSFGDPDNFVQACKKLAGYVLYSRDCNDNDPFEHPGQTWYLDADGDGYSDGTANTTSCTRPVGYRAVSELIKISGDCNDSDPSQFPNQVWFRDSDGDGFGDSNNSIKSCKKPSGYILNRRDCDDSNPAIFPGHGCPNALPAIIQLLLE
jgi:hypothetical protein